MPIYEIWTPVNLDYSQKKIGLFTKYNIKCTELLFIKTYSKLKCKILFKIREPVRHAESHQYSPAWRTKNRLSINRNRNEIYNILY